MIIPGKYLNHIYRGGVVTYRYVAGKAMQSPVYQDAILKARGQTRWLVLIDLDEFIVPIEKDSITEFLKDYEHCVGVGINWVCFDHNDYEEPPTQNNGLVTANYTRVAKNPDEFSANRMVKTIVNPNKVILIRSPHYYIYKNNYSAVTENFEPCVGKTKHHSSKKIRINHYRIRSIKGMKEKISKGCVWSGSPDARAKVQFTFDDDIELSDDYVIQKYLPRLKFAMGIKG